MQAMWATGSTFEMVMAYLIMPTFGWRVLVGVSALPLVVATCLMLTVPESARFLVATGRIKEAESVLETACHMNRVELPTGRLTVQKVVSL